jgi:HEAT repeat protein
MRRSVLAWLVGGVAVLGLAAVQFNQMQQFRAEIASLRAELRGTQEIVPSSAGTQTPPANTDRTAGLHGRLANVERTLADIAKATESLMDRGMVPPTEERLAQIQQRFFDPNVPDAERIRSLRMLKRGQSQLSDEIVTQALTMLQSSTNGNTRRQLLQQLDGVTNAAMKGPLIAILDSETSGNVREELVDVLGGFASDPAVDAKLWQLAMNDPDGEVREQAEEALTDGPATPERVQSLREKASNPNASLDERLLSLRALREANAQAPEVIADMANLAQTSTDPVERAKLFRAFDGINDPNLMSPLVHGLQDPNPVVRESAADALSSFAADPRIQEWLNHVIANDADPRVKREAFAALEQNQRRGRRGR